MNISLCTVLLGSLLLLSLACGTAGAVGRGDGQAPPPLEQAYVWYDGDVERRVWVNPTLIAEFNPSSESEGLVKNAYPSLQVVPNTRRGIRLWRVEKGDAIETRTSRMRAVHPTGQYSPVFHNGPVQNDAILALPGNILVYMNPAWNLATVHQWANARRLQIIKKLDFGPNIFLIKTGPGMEALDTANALYKSGEVVAAFPDWWTQVESR